MSHKYLSSYNVLIIIGGVPALFLLGCAFIYPLKLVLLLIGAEILFFLLGATCNGGYPELTDTELICRNVIYRFWSKHYKYEDIAKVVYCSMGPSGIYVYLKGKKWRKAHRTSCMEGKDVDDFLEELRSKGITVERPTTFRGQL